MQDASQPAEELAQGRRQMEREMSTIFATVEKLERETRDTRREVAGRLAIAGVSLAVALTIAYVVVASLTSAGILGA